MPPSPRGGHSATLTGASLVIFGVSYTFICKDTNRYDQGSDIFALTIFDIICFTINAISNPFYFYRVTSMKARRAVSSTLMTLMSSMSTRLDG